MASFEFLDKTLFRIYLHQIINILADNMSIIAPIGNSRDDSDDLLYVETYDNKLNYKSIGILGKIGLKVEGK